MLGCQLQLRTSLCYSTDSQISECKYQDEWKDQGEGSSHSFYLTCTIKQIMGLGWVWVVVGVCEYEVGVAGECV